MVLTFEALRPLYTSDLSEMKFTLEARATAVAKDLLTHRDRFLALQSKCGVPALWVMPVFYRENPSFDAYLGNGDPLNKPTVHVPKGRGPFDSWEAGAADALALDHVNLCPEWTWEGACWEWEKWNGFGPRKYHGRPTSYLWSGTTIYQGGMYIEDGKWSRGTWDRRPGTVIIAKMIASLDSELDGGLKT